MASNACDPLRVPAGFWRRDDVGNALDHHDIGALFRLLTRHETYARTALVVGESATPVGRSPNREAIARIDLSIALAHLGSLDEATAHGSQALSSVRVDDTVLSRAVELGKELMTRFPHEAIAQSFHEQYLQTTRHANEKRI